MVKTMPTIIPNDEWVKIKKEKYHPDSDVWNLEIGTELKKDFNNYDETRFGPDPIDDVIDRLGIFDADFTEDINNAEKYRGGMETVIKPNDIRPVHKMHRREMFDISPLGTVCEAISNFISLDYDKIKYIPTKLIHLQERNQMLAMHRDLCPGSGVFWESIRDGLRELAWQPERMGRFVIFLKDWVPGQVWVLGNRNFTHWRAGECFRFDWMHIPHATVNLSDQTRYTVFLTGIMTEQSYDFYNRGNKDSRYVLNEDQTSFIRV